MNKLTMTAITFFSMITLGFTAQAHDPKEHMKNAEKPKCEEMKNMDQDKIQSDLVMKAMMKKCMKLKQNTKTNEQSAKKEEIPANSKKHHH